MDKYDDNIDYQELYLNYKKKYLDLQNEMDGGMFRKSRVKKAKKASQKASKKAKKASDKAKRASDKAAKRKAKEAKREAKRKAKEAAKEAREEKLREESEEANRLASEAEKVVEDEERMAKKKVDVKAQLKAACDTKEKRKILKNNSKPVVLKKAMKTFLNEFVKKLDQANKNSIKQESEALEGLTDIKKDFKSKFNKKNKQIMTLIKKTVKELLKSKSYDNEIVIDSGVENCATGISDEYGNNYAINSNTQIILTKLLLDSVRNLIEEKQKFKRYNYVDKEISASVQFDKIVQNIKEIPVLTVLEEMYQNFNAKKFKDVQKIKLEADAIITENPNIDQLVRALNLITKQIKLNKFCAKKYSGNNGSIKLDLDSPSCSEDNLRLIDDLLKDINHSDEYHKAKINDVNKVSQFYKSKKFSNTRSPSDIKEHTIKIFRDTQKEIFREKQIGSDEDVEKYLDTNSNRITNDGFSFLISEHIKKTNNPGADQEGGNDSEFPDSLSDTPKL